MIYWRVITTIGAIEPVEVDREEDNFIVFSGGLKAVKTTEVASYYTSFDAAKDCLLRHAKRKVSALEDRLSEAAAELQRIRALEQPAERAAESEGAA